MWVASSSQAMGVHSQRVRYIDVYAIIYVCMHVAYMGMCLFMYISRTSITTRASVWAALSPQAMVVPLQRARYVDTSICVRMHTRLYTDIFTFMRMHTFRAYALIAPTYPLSISMI